MMYNEFVEGTGCRDNEFNYKVFKNLEIMYMNSNMSKAEIYEYGKKLVDNSKSEEELLLESEIKQEIEEHKAEIERYKEYVEENNRYIEIWKQDGDKEMIKFYKNSNNFCRAQIKEHRNRIAELKWVLG